MHTYTNTETTNLRDLNFVLQFYKILKSTEKKSMPAATMIFKCTFEHRWMAKLLFYYEYYQLYTVHFALNICALYFF